MSNLVDMEKAAGFAFTQKNYVWFGVGLGILIIGYLLLSGGGSDNPAVFSEEIFNTRRLVVAPIVVLTGYGTVFYAILRRG